MILKRTGLLSALLAIVLLCSCTFGFELPFSLSSSAPVVTTPSVSPTPSTPVSIVTNTELQVVVLDVGQADCILLKTGAHAMLIDAGNTGQDKLVLGYLALYGVNKLDYFVTTHPHADHIGTAAAVIRGMDSIGTILMPDTYTTTKTFENMLDAIEEKNVPITIAVPGDRITLGDAQIQILAPNGTGYTDLNDYSVVLRVEFGNSVFLFTGDAETKSENEQLAQDFPLSADVLKVGHHGSRTSSIPRYLEAVSPRYAVISCGEGNTYGHPHDETLAKLTATGADIFRTDRDGTVVFTTDGETITVGTARETGMPVTTPPVTLTAGPPFNAASYIGNVNSLLFHLPTCSSLPKESNRAYFASRDEAIEAGYTPCSICRP